MPCRTSDAPRLRRARHWAFAAQLDGVGSCRARLAQEAAVPKTREGIRKAQKNIAFCKIVLYSAFLTLFFFGACFSPFFSVAAWGPHSCREAVHIVDPLSGFKRLASHCTKTLYMPWAFMSKGLQSFECGAYHSLVQQAFVVRNVASVAQETCFVATYFALSGCWIFVQCTCREGTRLVCTKKAPGTTSRKLAQSPLSMWCYLNIWRTIVQRAAQKRPLNVIESSPQRKLNTTWQVVHAQRWLRWYMCIYIYMYIYMHTILHCEVMWCRSNIHVYIYIYIVCITDELLDYDRMASRLFLFVCHREHW